MLAFNRSRAIVVRAATRIRSEAAWRRRWWVTSEPSTSAASKLERKASMATSARLNSCLSGSAVDADLWSVLRALWDSSCGIAGWLTSGSVGGCVAALLSRTTRSALGASMFVELSAGVDRIEPGADLIGETEGC